MGAHLTDLLDLSRADITSKRPGKRQAALESISELAQRIRALREIDAIEPPLPTGIGNAMMERFALPPSRRIGELKEALEAAVAAGAIEARREPGYYLPFVERLLAGEAIAAPELPPVDDSACAHDDPDDDGAGAGPRPDQTS
jgi:poly(A) polymerase